MTFANQLAFWSRDPDQIHRIIMASGMNRDKWERDDYAERTIGKAIRERTAFYDPHYHQRNGTPSIHSIHSMTATGSNGTSCQADSVEVQGLRLTVTEARKTKSGKISVTFAVSKDGTESTW